MVRTSLQFRQIVNDFSDRVGRTARRILGNDEDAEEAVQDIFLKIYRGLGDFKGESDISTWIYRISVNTCISRRRKARRPELLLDDPGDIAEIADCGDDPEGLFQREEDRARLAALVALLPDKEAKAITLYYMEEQDYRQISEIMGIPTGSVATVLHRGRIHLHQLFLKGEKGTTI
jgi:RNA polymerase sigma-70 factor (ECF subfamily)